MQQSNLPHLDILYKDESLVVLNKPPGLICHPVGHYQGDSMISRLHYFFDKIWLTHRLDQGTSGILVAARTSKAVESLNHQFEKRRVKKQYLALVQGRMYPEQGEIIAPLALDTSLDAIIKIKMHITHQGMPSCTSYHTLYADSKVSLLLVEPKTGRKHQIRLHLASIGHPVIGETLYTHAGLPFLWEYYTERLSPWSSPMRGYGLHAYTISFQHPIGKQPITFNAPVPQDWWHYLQQMGISPEPISQLLQPNTTTPSNPAIEERNYGIARNAE